MMLSYKGGYSLHPELGFAILRLSRKGGVVCLLVKGVEILDIFGVSGLGNTAHRLGHQLPVLK